MSARSRATACACRGRRRCSSTPGCRATRWPRSWPTRPSSAGGASSPPSPVSTRSMRRRAFAASSAAISARGSAGCSSSSASVSAAASPTTWDSARRCRSSPCSQGGERAAPGARRDTARGRRGGIGGRPRPAAVAHRRAAFAALQLARRGGPLRAAPRDPRAPRRRTPLRSRDPRGVRPRPHHLRHAQAGHRSAVGDRVRLLHPRRGAGDQELEHRRGTRRAPLAGAASSGRHRHAGREPPGRALEPVRVPEPRAPRAPVELPRR